MRPGQVAPTQRVVGRPGGAAVITKPGIIRGPAGALRTVRPANIAHNPIHRVGRAGARYNRQAFVFHRGHSHFRRAYYIGPAGAIFFYDEALPENDASYTLDENAIPSCPEDSDDCQGLDQSYETGAVDPKAEALQFLMSLMPNVAWEQDGLMISGDQDDVLVAYGDLEVAVNHYFPFGAGPEQLFVGTTGLLGGTGVRIYSGSYNQNKTEWDKVIIALRKLGVRAATPGGSDRDIRSIR